MGPVPHTLCANVTSSPPPDPSSQSPPPPRAFAQGVGTVFQFVGVILFLAMTFTCCGSGLLSREWATRDELSRIGWDGYSAQRAITISVFCGVFFGIALAGVGLGLQAEHQNAATGGVALTAIGTLFWLVHTVFAVQHVRSIALILIAAALTVLFAILLTLSINALNDMRRNPPPPGHDVLPADYKVPYSHYHVDPPEVRLAAELEQRRQRLAVQQKELEMLEEKLKRRIDEK